MNKKWIKKWIKELRKNKETLADGIALIGSLLAVYATAIILTLLLT